MGAELVYVTLACGVVFFLGKSLFHVLDAAYRIPHHIVSSTDKHYVAFDVQTMSIISPVRGIPSAILLNISIQQSLPPCSPALRYVF